MTAIAVASAVHKVTSESHQRPVFASEIQRYRRNLKPSSNPRFIVVICVCGLSLFRTIQHYSEHHQNRRSRQKGLGIFSISHRVSFWANKGNQSISLFYAVIMKRSVLVIQYRRTGEL